MTRPSIIRADTIDLQDKSSPTAQDHSQQPEHPAPLGIGPAAPHQQAAIRRVEQERNSEEVRLQNAWSSAGTALREDPGSDDERTGTDNAKGMQQDEQAIRLNGGMSVEQDADDADMQDADVEEDMDDDMDKISSSPSIDDGGYSLPLPPAIWPARRESLTPQSSPMQSTVASSSPFNITPVHFPLFVASARRPERVPARDIRTIPESSYPIPISYQFSHSSTLQSAEHHRGEYAWTRIPDTLEEDHEDTLETAMSPRSKQRKVVERRLQIMREDSQGSLMSELDEDQAKSMLQPTRCPQDSSDDPFVESSSPAPRRMNSTPPPSRQHPDEEDDSWTTDSDADSWDEDHKDNDDASNDVSFSNDSRFVDSGWGGECLRETEDIDFEFVYALHTFVATVEGQANATKGDTMVLLDDSNSYWWLVRVVKDNSIGYLPAEHIETPTERLARLNKHRNIDLSATMLGDTAEKSKNPLKKAMRRRNAKTVQFAPPTYVEASDYDYSSDEGDGELFGGPEPKQIQQQQAAQEVEPEQDSSLAVQPLKVNGAKKDGRVSADSDIRTSDDAARADENIQRASDEAVDRPLDPKVSKNGTLRNTDSFFKDESTETRKITLTPNLLRDTNSESSSLERGPSLESLEKNGFADKVKDDKKKKDKKPGMLSGLFKRKDKKGKGQQDSTDSDVEKQSEEVDRTSPQSKPSEESLERTSAEQAAVAPVRQTSKGRLQKLQRSRDDSPQKTKGILKTESPTDDAVQSAATSEAVGSKPPAQQATSTMRMVPSEEESEPMAKERTLSPERSASALRNPFKSRQAPQSTDPKPEKLTQVKQRMQLDDFDSEDDEGSDPFADPDAQPKPVPIDVHVGPSEPIGRLSESPVHVTAADAQPPSKAIVHEMEREKEPDAQQPPGLTHDSSSQETSSPVSTPTPDDSPMKTIPEDRSLSLPHSHGPEPGFPTHLAPINTTNLIPPPSRPAPVPTKTLDHEHNHEHPNEHVQSSPPTSSETSQLPPWNDAALRAYLDDGSDVRDMLIVINDTTGVVPVGPDHPLMNGLLFTEETKSLDGMSRELDRLLSGLMSKGKSGTKSGGVGSGEVGRSVERRGSGKGSGSVDSTLR